jgi:hypothetical protein
MAKEKPYCLGAFVVVLLVLSRAINCLAQEPIHDHSCTVSGAGVFATPEGKDRDNFNHGGWGFQAGGGFAVTRQAEPNRGLRLYLTGNYLYDKFRVRESALLAAIPKEPAITGAVQAHGSFSAVTFDPTLRYTHGRYSPYLLGGFGWLRRGLGFNGANKVPPLFPNGTSLDQVVSNSGVFDLGGGVNVVPSLRLGLMLFIEGRFYHGTAINSGSSLVPISVGVRW